MIILDKIETIIFDGIENMFLIMFLRILSSRFGVLSKGFIFQKCGIGRNADAYSDLISCWGLKRYQKRYEPP